MDSGEKNKKAEIFVVLNPIAGNASAADIRQALEQHFNQQESTFDIYETTGKEDVAELVAQACQNGAELIVAAGGDGTVAGAVNGLIGSGAMLGIVPVGTGNGLARALSIPLGLEESVELLSERQSAMYIDAMQVGERVFILNMSAGISARAMRSTPPEQKRRYGMLAYAWTILQEAFGFRARRFNLSVDNHCLTVHATEILVSNGRVLQEAPLPLGPRERLNDGIFDVYILMAQTIFDYLRTISMLLLQPGQRRSKLRVLSARKTVRIEAIGRQQPVQADGEVIGTTPVEVTVLKDALKVIVPQEINTTSSTISN